LSAYIDLGFGGPACRAQLLAHSGEVRYSLAAAGASETGVIEIDGMELAGSTDFWKYYGFYQEDRHFLDCVRSRTEPETSIQDALKTMLLLEMFLTHVI
jgi:hypothetical protein